MPSSSEPKDYYRREWLNRPGHHEGAYILAHCRRGYFNPTVLIADCSRCVRLEFPIGGERPVFRNSLRKLDLLITTLTEFRAAVVAVDASRRDRHWD